MLATAKIHILKQFTTNGSQMYYNLGLCLLLQRYTFWSNSQRAVGAPHRRDHCACYCKDTHFEAIHNQGTGSPTIHRIVLATAKIHILKQFTTCRSFSSLLILLCLLLQRYTFWSNSQLMLTTSYASLHCACYCKDTHFEAIHNWCLVW